MKVLEDLQKTAAYGSAGSWDLPGPEHAGNERIRSSSAGFGAARLRSQQVQNRDRYLLYRYHRQTQSSDVSQRRALPQKPLDVYQLEGLCLLIKPKPRYHVHRIPQTPRIALGCARFPARPGQEAGRTARPQEKELLEQIFRHAIVHGTDRRRRKRHF